MRIDGAKGKSALQWPNIGLNGSPDNTGSLFGEGLDPWLAY